jgi:hypothetical protein
MLAAADLSALISGRHADPFSVLGMHSDGGDTSSGAQPRWQFTKRRVMASWSAA